MTEGRWIIRNEAPPPKHFCNPPSHDYSTTPLGEVGDVWQCGVCRNRWRVIKARTTSGKEWTAKRPLLCSFGIHKGRERIAAVPGTAGATIGSTPCQRCGGD